MHTALTLIAELLPALAGPPALPPARMDRFPGAVVAEAADTARTRQRLRSIGYGPGYSARRSIHRVTSFAMIPLFVGAYVTGNQLIRHRQDPPGWATALHKPIAVATGVVFAANTVTGAWNFWESRKDPAGQAKRTAHGLLFLAAGAGFLYAGTALAADVKDGTDPNRFHRTVAVASMGISAVSWGMMLFFP